MKRATGTLRIASLFLTGVLSIAATSSALAEYRLTAFGDTLGYRSLISVDVEGIQSKFEGADLSRLNHFEANNLCVAQILLKDFDEAINSCNAAVSKTKKALAISPSVINLATASIYSNMAVAKAMNGDKASAIKDLELAMSYNSMDKNINTNYDQLSPVTNLTAALR